MIKVRVNVTDGASDMLAEVISMLTGPEMVELNSVGGRAATEEAAKYHREFDQAGGWRGRRFGGEKEGGSSFGANVARGWSMLPADETGVTIANDAEHLGFKVTGGTIRPKRAKALTIPIIPEARGKSAYNYSIDNDTRLFTIRGKNALFERIDTITSGSRGRRSQAGATPIRARRIRAVFALLKSVTQGPWPGALPPTERIADAFVGTWRTEMLNRLARE